MTLVKRAHVKLALPIGRDALAVILRELGQSRQQDSTRGSSANIPDVRILNGLCMSDRGQVNLMENTSKYKACRIYFLEVCLKIQRIRVQPIKR